MGTRIILAAAAIAAAALAGCSSHGSQATSGGQLSSRRGQLRDG